LVGPLEGWLVASERLGALRRIRRGALGRGCGREGGGAQVGRCRGRGRIRGRPPSQPARRVLVAEEAEQQLVRVRLGLGLGLGFGLGLGLRLTRTLTLPLPLPVPLPLPLTCSSYGIRSQKKWKVVPG
jgi:hypothetical protein